MTFLFLPHAPRFAVLAECLIGLQFPFGSSVLHMFPSSSSWLLWETALCLPVILGVVVLRHPLAWWGELHDQDGQSEDPFLQSLVIFPPVSTVVSTVPSLAPGSSPLPRPLPQPSHCCLCLQSCAPAIHPQLQLISLNSVIPVLKSHWCDSLFSVNTVLSLQSAIPRLQDLAPAYLSVPGGLRSLSTHQIPSRVYYFPVWET